MRSAFLGVFGFTSEGRKHFGKWTMLMFRDESFCLSAVRAVYPKSSGNGF